MITLDLFRNIRNLLTISFHKTKAIFCIVQNDVTINIVDATVLCSFMSEISSSYIARRGLLKFTTENSKLYERSFAIFQIRAPIFFPNLPDYNGVQKNIRNMFVHSC